MRCASVSAVCLALLFGLAPSPALACACCTDPGERNVTFSKLESGMIEMMQQVEFAKKWTSLPPPEVLRASRE